MSVVALRIVKSDGVFAFLDDPTLCSKQLGGLYSFLRLRIVDVKQRNMSATQLKLPDRTVDLCLGLACCIQHGDVNYVDPQPDLQSHEL